VRVAPGSAERSESGLVSSRFRDLSLRAMDSSRATKSPFAGPMLSKLLISRLIPAPRATWHKPPKPPWDYRRALDAFDRRFSDSAPMCLN